MPHLFVDLYDGVDDSAHLTLDDRALFYDLNSEGWADLAARVIVRPGDEYRVGDHVRLHDGVRTSLTDTITVDPQVAPDVNLNELDFADRAAALLIVINPNPSGTFRLRAELFDGVGQPFPNLTFYDFEATSDRNLLDLNLFHFADKTAFIRIVRGPGFVNGDRIRLWDSLDSGSRRISLEPGEYDLNGLDWADKAAGLEFQIRSPR